MQDVSKPSKVNHTKVAYHSLKEAMEALKLAMGEGEVSKDEKDVRAELINKTKK